MMKDKKHLFEVFFMLCVNNFLIQNFIQQLLYE